MFRSHPLLQPLDGVALLSAAEAAATETARSTAECVAIAEAEEQQAAAAAALSPEAAAAAGMEEEEQKQQSGLPLSEADCASHLSSFGMDYDVVGDTRRRAPPPPRPVAGALLVDVPLPLEGGPAAGAAPRSLLDEDGAGGGEGGGGGSSSTAPFRMVQGIERHSTSRGR